MIDSTAEDGGFETVIGEWDGPASDPDATLARETALRLCRYLPGTLTQELEDRAMTRALQRWADERPADRDRLDALDADDGEDEDDGEGPDRGFSYDEIPGRRWGREIDPDRYEIDATGGTARARSTIVKLLGGSTVRVSPTGIRLPGPATIDDETDELVTAFVDTWLDEWHRLVREMHARTEWPPDEFFAFAVHTDAERFRGVIERSNRPVGSIGGYVLRTFPIEATRAAKNRADDTLAGADLQGPTARLAARLRGSDAAEAFAPDPLTAGDATAEGSNMTDRDAELVLEYAPAPFREDLLAEAFPLAIGAWRQDFPEWFAVLDEAAGREDSPFSWDAVEIARTGPLLFSHFTPLTIEPVVACTVEALDDEVRELAWFFGWTYLAAARNEVRRRQAQTIYAPREFVAFVFDAEWHADAAFREMDISDGNYQRKKTRVAEKRARAEATVELTEAIYEQAAEDEDAHLTKPISHRRRS